MPLLIVGETGVGKTQLAKAIHASSPRKRKPLVVVPCEQLKFVAAELCGHVRGAWTGADRDDLGYVRRAEGGTVILDRIDELPAEHQRCLIPILDHRVRPEGSAVEMRVDVRFIATCQDEKKLVAGVARRLSGATLRLPSLRERQADIPHFIRIFLRNRRQISGHAVAHLGLHPWRGNLAELHAVIERLVATTDRWIGKLHVRQILTKRNSSEFAVPTQFV